MSRGERAWDLERKDKARGCCTTSVPSCAAFRPPGAASFLFTPSRPYLGYLGTYLGG